MTIERRLQRVERRLARYRLVTLGLAAALGLLLAREVAPTVQADAGTVAETVRARQFEVVNADGTIAARLGGGIFNSGELVLAGYAKPISPIRSIQLFGSGIAFHSKTIDPSVDMSQILVTIGADENGGLFAIYNGEEKLSVGGRADGAGDGELTVADADGQALVRLGADGRGPAGTARAGVLEFFAGDGEAALRLGPVR